MEWPGVAINAAVLTTSIGVDTRLKSDIGAVIVSDDCARPVTQELRSREGILFRIPVFIRFQMNFLKPVDRVA